ncbi:MAG: hypothetical protein SWO11_21530 [Thermodesulfobacteriota bacterium]|nr:hypothetical protein [Thermodesulfobacteriota bacterium]
MSWWHYLFPKRTTMDHLCGHEAIYCARVARHNGYDQRVWLGSVKGEKDNHAQAQAKINGVWEWLEMYGKDVIVGEMDRDFKPTREYSLENFWFLWVTG